MSLLLFDSPKKYGSDALTKNTLAAFFSGVSYNATGGRNSEPAYTFSSGASTVRAYYHLPRAFAAGDTIIVGRHVYLTALDDSLLALTEGTPTASVAWAGSLYVNSDGELEWKTASDGTVRATSTLTVSTATHYFMEVVVTLATGATGTVQVYVNGVEYINVSGIITASTATAIRTIRLRGGGSRWDCFYVVDTVGDAPTARLGPVKEVILYPAADTADADFTPSTGADGYAMVDDATPDEDSTYIESDVQGDLSLLEHSDGITSSDIKGIFPFSRVKKDASGVMACKTVLQVGATQHKSDLFVPSSSAYAYVGKFYGVDPETTVPWEANDLNAATIGIEATTDVDS